MIPTHIKIVECDYDTDYEGREYEINNFLARKPNDIKLNHSKVKFFNYDSPEIKDYVNNKIETNPIVLYNRLFCGYIRIDKLYRFVMVKFTQK